MQQSLESLQVGQVEAAELIGPLAAAASRNPELRVLYDTHHEWEALTHTQPMLHALGAYDDVIAAIPDIARRLADSFTASHTYAREHASELIEEYVAANGGDRERLQGQAQTIGETYSWTLSNEDRHTVQLTADLMHEFEYVDRRYTAEQLVAPGPD